VQVLTSSAGIILSRYFEQTMHDSLIAKSGQLPVFRGALAGLVVGTLVMMVAPRLHDAIPIYITYPLGVLLAIGSTVFLATRICCPRCRTRIVWDAIRQHPAELQDALYRGSCRRCGHAPARA
jgi:hypothetical protein